MLETLTCVLLAHEGAFPAPVSPRGLYWAEGKGQGRQAPVSGARATKGQPLPLPAHTQTLLLGPPQGPSPRGHGSAWPSHSIKSLYEPEMKLEQGKKKGRRSESMERWKESERRKGGHTQALCQRGSGCGRAGGEGERERTSSIQESLALAFPAAPGPQSSPGCPANASS